MSDCVYWAFQDHLKHLGLEPVDGSKALFNALRQPALKPPEARQWARYGNSYYEQEELNWWQKPLAKTHTYEYQDTYTPGQAVPIVLNTLAAYNNLKVVAEWDEWYDTPDWLMSAAKTDVQRNLMRTTAHLLGTKVATESYTLSPAIYLFLDGMAMNKHAHFFADRIPYDMGSIVGAFQLQTLDQ
jgi:hypothetical protein